MRLYIEEFFLFFFIVHFVCFKSDVNHINENLLTKMTSFVAIFLRIADKNTLVFDCCLY